MPYPHPTSLKFLSQGLSRFYLLCSQGNPELLIPCLYLLRAGLHCVPSHHLFGARDGTQGFVHGRQTFYRTCMPLGASGTLRKLGDAWVGVGEMECDCPLTLCFRHLYQVQQRYLWAEQCLPGPGQPLPHPVLCLLLLW